MRALLGALALVAAVLVAALLVLSRHDQVGPPAATVAVGEALGGDAEGYLRALAPRTFAFPADHGPHPGYRTEWWYYTGNLATAAGRHFGFQLTFFRIMLAPRTEARSSAWAAQEVFMAHFAVTDTAGQRFHHQVRFAREALGLAGATGQPFRVWTEDWSAEGEGPAALPMRLRAGGGEAAIDLRLESATPPVLQGERGLSRKGPEAGNASYYYSLTRMPAGGTVTVGGQRFAVQGLAWMDREWSTSALGSGLEGWDWFALQLADGRDVMLYRLRQRGGGIDRFSAGTVVAADGSVRSLGPDDVRLEIVDRWTSPRGGTRYPSRWRLAIPAEDLALEIVPRLADQELLEPVRYWEGAVVVTGAAGGRPLAGQGYAELVGYAAGTRRDTRGAAATMRSAPIAASSVVRTAGMSPGHQPAASPLRKGPRKIPPSTPTR